MKIISKNKEIRYEQVTTDNMDLAFNIQKNEWKDNPDKENFLDKAINAKKDYVSFIAYYNNVPIGITGVYTENIYKESIWLDWFCVVPEFRNRGFGKQILEDTIDYVRDLRDFLYFRIETTYWKGRPAVSLYDKIMQIKEKYTLENDNKNNPTLIYTYCFTEKCELWNNRYLGLNNYYGRLKNENIFS